MDEQFEQREKVELAMYRAEHQKKFQMMIDFVKEQVGNGAEYINSVAHMVVSTAGGYCELNDLPEEFTGAVGPNIEQAFLREKDAIGMLEAAAQAVDTVAATNTRQLQIMAIYSRRGLVDRKNCYIVNYVNGTNGTPGHEPIGRFQSGIMPLFFKIKIDSNDSLMGAAVEMNRCILACMITKGDLYPLLKIRFDGDQTTDLTAHAPSRSIQ